MRNKILRGITILAATIMCASAALAIPTLQLGIGGGVYDPVSETTIATSDQFTLYAYLTPRNSILNNSAKLSELLNSNFFISAAVMPKQHQAADLGSFTFNLDTVDVTAGMVYGVPPVGLSPFVEPDLSHDGGDLGQHGIFETYFKEFTFKFDSTKSITPFNVDGHDEADAGGQMYYVAFSVNTASLEPGHAIHFDLYNEKILGSSTTNDLDIDIGDYFAPFSHDAQSRVVPEPSTLLLLGSGLIGAAVWTRYRKAK